MFAVYAEFKTVDAELPFFAEEIAEVAALVAYADE